MNRQAVSNDLSFGQLFLFQETAARKPVLYQPPLRKARRRQLRLHPTLRNAAIAGFLLGFAGAVLFQYLQPVFCG